MKTTRFNVEQSVIEIDDYSLTLDQASYNDIVSSLHSDIKVTQKCFFDNIQYYNTIGKSCISLLKSQYSSSLDKIKSIQYMIEELKLKIDLQHKLFPAKGSGQFDNDDEINFPEKTRIQAQNQIIRPEHFPRPINMEKLPYKVNNPDLVGHLSPWEGSEYKISLLHSLIKKSYVKLIFCALSHNASIWRQRNQATRAAIANKQRTMLKLCFASLVLNYLVSTAMALKSMRKAKMYSYVCKARQSMISWYYYTQYNLGTKDKYKMAATYYSKRCLKYYLNVWIVGMARRIRILRLKKWAIDSDKYVLLQYTFYAWMMAFVRSTKLKRTLMMRLLHNNSSVSLNDTPKIYTKTSNRNTIIEPISKQDRSMQTSKLTDASFASSSAFSHKSRKSERSQQPTSIQSLESNKSSDSEYSILLDSRQIVLDLQAKLRKSLNSNAPVMKPILNPKEEPKRNSLNEKDSNNTINTNYKTDNNRKSSTLHRLVSLSCRGKKILNKPLSRSKISSRRNPATQSSKSVYNVSSTADKSSRALEKYKSLSSFYSSKSAEKEESESSAERGNQSSATVQSIIDSVADDINILESIMSTSSEQLSGISELVDRALNIVKRENTTDIERGTGEDASSTTTAHPSIISNVSKLFDNAQNDIYDESQEAYALITKLRDDFKYLRSYTVLRQKARSLRHHSRMNIKRRYFQYLYSSWSIIQPRLNRLLRISDRVYLLTLLRKYWRRWRLRKSPKHSEKSTDKIALVQELGPQSSIQALKLPKTLKEVFCFWKNKTKKVKLFQRVFSICNLAWELRYQRYLLFSMINSKQVESSIQHEVCVFKYYFLIEIIREWRNLAIQNASTRQESRNNITALVFRGRHLLSRVFHVWRKLTYHWKTWSKMYIRVIFHAWKEYSRQQMIHMQNKLASLASRSEGYLRQRYFKRLRFYSSVLSIAYPRKHFTLSLLQKYLLLWKENMQVAKYYRSLNFNSHSNYSTSLNWKGQLVSKYLLIWKAKCSVRQRIKQGNEILERVYWRAKCRHYLRQWPGHLQYRLATEMRKRRLMNPKNTVTLVDHKIERKKNKSVVKETAKLIKEVLPQRQILPLEERMKKLGYVRYSNYTTGDREQSEQQLTQLNYLKLVLRTVLLQWRSEVLKQRRLLQTYRTVTSAVNEWCMRKYWHIWIIKSSYLSHRATVWLQYYHPNDNTNSFKKSLNQRVVNGWKSVDVASLNACQDKILLLKQEYKNLRNCLVCDRFIDYDSELNNNKKTNIESSKLLPQGKKFVITQTGSIIREA